MSTEQLTAAAAQLITDLRATRDAYDTKLALVNAALADSSTYLNQLTLLATRLETARDRIETATGEPGGGGGTFDDIAVVHALDVGDNARTLTLLNSVPSGPVVYNWGGNRVPGASGTQDGPFGFGLRGQSQSGTNTVVTIDQELAFPGDFQIEYIADTFDAGAIAMQISTNGTDGGELRVRLEADFDENDKLFFYCYAQKAGTAGFLAFETAPIEPMAVAGYTAGYHLALGRVGGYIVAHSNNNRVGISAAPFLGTLTGYVDLRGGYDRVGESASGSYQKNFGELRLTRTPRYTGATYTVPTARLTP